MLDIESKLKRIEEDPEGSGTSRLFECIQGVTSIANHAFEQLFERQVYRVSFLRCYLKLIPCFIFFFRFKFL